MAAIGWGTAKTSAAARRSTRRSLAEARADRRRRERGGEDEVDRAASRSRGRRCRLRGTPPARRPAPPAHARRPGVGRAGGHGGGAALRQASCGDATQLDRRLRRPRRRTIAARCRRATPDPQDMALTIAAMMTLGRLLRGGWRRWRPPADIEAHHSAGDEEDRAAGRADLRRHHRSAGRVVSSSRTVPSSRWAPVWTVTTPSLFGAHAPCRTSDVVDVHCAVTDINTLRSASRTPFSAGRLRGDGELARHAACRPARRCSGRARRPSRHEDGRSTRPSWGPHAHDLDLTTLPSRRAVSRTDWQMRHAMAPVVPHPYPGVPGSIADRRADHAGGRAGLCVPGADVIQDADGRRPLARGIDAPTGTSATPSWPTP